MRRIKAFKGRNLCIDYLQFHKFKNAVFDVEDKEPSGKPKKYDDAEFETYLEEDSNHSKE